MVVKDPEVQGAAGIDNLHAWRTRATGAAKAVMAGLIPGMEARVGEISARKFDWNSFIKAPMMDGEQAAALVTAAGGSLKDAVVELNYFIGELKVAGFDRPHFVMCVMRMVCV